MSPFMGSPIGFSPATLALLDAALTDMCADFERARAKAPIAEAVAAPLVSEIVIARIGPLKLPASIVAQKQSAKKAAGGLRFNKARGWELR
jgi:hypothetical protein